MAKTIVMPKVGISVESCILTKWHKKKGDSINIDDLLFSYETDKVTAEELAQDTGVLLEILVEEGTDVVVLEAVAVIGSVDEDITELLKTVKKTEQATVSNKTETVEVTKDKKAALGEGTINAFATEDFKASPRAKQRAVKSGVNLKYVKGSGPEGRIIERDVIAMKDGSMVFTSAALAKEGTYSNIESTGLGAKITTNDLNNAKAVTGEVEIVKLSNIRQVIAKSVTYSLNSMAQLTNSTSFDATSIVEFRSMLKNKKDSVESGISLNDIIIYVVSKTLKNHKDLNAHLIDDALYYFKNVHMGIAVDTARGLLVPTLLNVDSMSLIEVSQKAKELIESAKNGTISLDLLSGATFTISNLGSMGIESFTPIINAPQTGILGVCAIIEKVKTTNKKLETYPAMGLSLSYNHQVIDGAPAARFTLELKNNLEKFKEFLNEQGESYE